MSSPNKRFICHSCTRPAKLLSRLISGVVLLFLFLYFFIFLLLLLRRELFFQFSLLLRGTLVFLCICGLWGVSSLLVFQYFLLQEFLAFHLLLRSSSAFLAIVLLFRGGFSPLHFWVFYFVKFLEGFPLVWFLTVQKVFYVYLLAVFLSEFLFYSILFGLIFVYFQMLSVVRRKDLLVLSRTESLGWSICLLSLLSGAFFIFILLYFVVMFLLIRSLVSLKIPSWDLSFFLISVPLGLSFLFKFLSLVFLLPLLRFILVLVLVLVSLSVLSLGLFMFSYCLKSSSSFGGGSSYLWLVFSLLLFLHQHSVSWARNSDIVVVKSWLFLAL